MAVPEQTPYIEYTANGVATSFALGFDCESKDHLIVTLDSVEPPVENWSLTDGAVVFTTAPTNGVLVVIQRNTPFSRTTDYQSYNNSFRPPAVNNDFDRVWWKIQELGVRDWLLDLKIQKFRDDVNLTALENTLEEAKQIRDDTANSVVEVQSNVVQSQSLLADTTTQANLAQGYANSANSANAAAQQAAIDLSAAESNVYSALSAQQIAVNNSLTAIAGGHKAYQTLALAQAAQASLPANTIVEVTNDGANNGTYQWNGTTLTKSAYDPLTQSKSYTDNKLDFIVGLPENNRFIKELYVTGWNGTDEIYLQYFTNNDNGKVTFIFKNKTANRDVVYTYQKAQGLQIYPLETAGAATGSGFGGYIVVDWNAYTTAINAQGAYTYTYKVTKKALNLVNCPFIKEYLDTNSINASISVHTADISVLKEVNAKSTTLSSTATHAQAANLNNFIKSIKLKDGHTSGFSYFIDSIVQTATTAIINIKYYNPENPSQANPWAVNNITLTKGVSAIETYEVRKEGYRWLITLDWNYKPAANVTGGTLSSLPLNLNKLFEEDIVDLQLSQPSFYKVRNDIKDGQSKLASFLSGATFTANGDTAYTQTVTKVEDGARIVLTNTNANVNRRFLYRMIPFYVRIPDTYFIYVKFTINAVSTEANSFISYISHSGKNSSAASFFDNVRAGQTYEEVRKITGDATGTRSTEGSLFLEFWSAATSPAGVQLDITIHDIRLLANYDQDPVFLNKERKEIEQLVRAVGYFESEIVIPKFVDTALQQQNINKGLEMQSLGDSTSVMVMWQERLAQMKGWHFNRTMAISGLNGKYPLALGGSWCEPIISNFGAVGASGQNHYTRSSSIADYGIDVLFVLSSYNGQHIGKAWQTGGQLVKSDHGINDEPYHGGEVNLITNPTADFPSFGASYYGMLEKIMTANPNTRIVLLTLYLFNVTGNDLANILAKNAVIRKAAEKYNLQLIDLEKISGINSFTASTLCFEGGVHINQKGGDRLAQVIGGLV